MSATTTGAGVQEDFAPQGEENTKLSDLGIDIPIPSGPSAPPNAADAIPGGNMKKVSFADVDEVNYYDGGEEDDMYESQARRPLPSTSAPAPSFLEKPVLTIKIIDLASLAAGVAAAFYAARIPLAGSYLGEFHIATRIAFFTILIRLLLAVLAFTWSKLTSKSSGGRQRGDKRRRRR